MRIRQIELVGFKSFREPTRLVLSAGVNAIVGPNGCGKSNVADAIRWALGEQSVKHLRAKDMEDVIFGGNSKSAPLNFAEVSLTFEKADENSFLLAGEAEGLAAHVARLHEFTVTRRLFRSGDSQYFVNQAPARLRDITEMFLGSGVGTKAYAMIEQGRVGQIVNAKPEDLRLFIEEAAGTTRFRSRKIAAERKLERTGENLARVQDVMREIDRQLATLRRQARRAEEFRLLEAEHLQTELAVAGARWRALVAERDDLTADLAAARGRVSGEQAEVAAAEEQRSLAQASEARASQEIEEAFVALAEIGSAVVRASERQTAARDSVSGLGARIDRAREEGVGLDGRDDELRNSLAEAEGRRDEWVERETLESRALEAAEADVARLEPEFEAGRSQHAAAAAVVNELRVRSASALGARAECATRLDGLTRERERLQTRVVDRERDVAATSVRIDAAGAALEAARSAHGRLEADRRDAAADLRSREAEQRRLEESVAAIREALLHVRGRLDGLRERERSLDGYAEGLAAAMAQESHPLGLLLDALRIPSGLERAVAAVLGDVLRGAIVERPEDGAAIAERLRRADAGRLALVPVGAAPASGGRGDLPEGVAPLAPMIGADSGREFLRDAIFEDVGLAEDLESAVAAWRSGRGRWILVTRQGEVVDRHGVVIGGGAPASADLLQRRRELGELASQIAEDEVRQAAVEVRLAEVREESAAMANALRRLDAEAHAATLALVAAEHAFETALRDRRAADERLAEANEELRTSVSAFDAARIAVEAAERELAEVSTQTTEASASLAEAELELERRRESLEWGKARRDGCRSAVVAAREESLRAAGDVDRYQRERSALAVRRDALEQDVRSLTEERTSTVTLLAQLDVEVAERRAELAERERAVEGARERARQSQVELRENDARLARARATLDEAREESNALEVRLAERRAQLDSLALSTRERHEIDVETVEIPPEFDVASAVTRIQELRDRIARLGDVNVAAIADARELEERHGFLESQRRDLEASMEDLRKTIAELSQTTRARFRDTFELANVRFQEFFAELFRGGRASLELTNPHNLLESGVLMQVQPPGKTVRALQSLSGGEQALTAISLLMALFSLRATPFCVLDEVDAPLDGANVTRFDAMLRRMSERTQFIVITHKQPTMEVADALYGVTMAEAGVSQLVSVALPKRGGGGGGADAEGPAEEFSLAASA